MHKNRLIIVSIIFCIIIAVVFLFYRKTEVVRDLKFDPFTNFSNSKDTLFLNADLSNAITNGIIIPTINQSKEGGFVCNIEFKRKSKEKLFYKIYYQNDSYKFEDSLYSRENFYGSWENTDIGFKEISGNSDLVKIKDTIRIVGNPRNEKKYFGMNLDSADFSKEKIKSIIKAIKDTPEWLKSVKEKAIHNKTSLDDQLYADALWTLGYQMEQGNFNQRFKRNPRMGLYKFYIVFAAEDAMKKIPQTVQYIDKIDSNKNFTNPIYYFTKGEGKSLNNVSFIESKKLLNVKTVFGFDKAIFINPISINVNNANIDESYYNSLCNSNKETFKKALFEQFFSYIPANYMLKNIPEVADVINDNITREQYNEYVKKYTDSKDLIIKHASISDCPCKTVGVDSLSKSIVIKNPGNKNNEFEKQIVGIRSRVGFVYGKFFAKIKFPELLNKYNVWNGVTNAYWLIYQSNYEWNQRRKSTIEGGYIPKGFQGPEGLTHKTPYTNYSEIDFEIVKESKYWPSNQPSNDKPNLQNDVMVTCTNWDMANKEPKSFIKNIGNFEYQKDTFTLFRWGEWYQALTHKHPEKNDELFKKDYYWYEIEWTPTKIEWKIGAEKNNMRTICVMDTSVTSIPNNQMLMIMSQEFHYQEWWPLSPFKQNFIPFPKNDIIGKMLEFEVE